MTELTNDERTVLKAVAFFDTQTGEAVTDRTLNYHLGGKKLTLVRRSLASLRRAGLVACDNDFFFERFYRLTDSGRAAL